MTGGQSPPDPVEGKHHTPHHFVTKADFPALRLVSHWLATGRTARASEGRSHRA